MGAVLSTVYGYGKSVKALGAAIWGLISQYNALDARINAEPGLPRPNPTQPFWLNDPPYPELVDVQSEQLPEEVDVVVVGSGITAAGIVRSLLEGDAEGKKPSVVVLEARQICSGATGRNGGHIKAPAYEMMSSMMSRSGLSGERAAAITRFQLSHLKHVLALCESDPERFGVAEAREVETVDLVTDEGHFLRAKKMVALLEKWVPEFPIQIWNAEETQKKFSTSTHVVGGISYRAGALWPYRFVTSVWRRLLDENKTLSIETSTPAESITVVDGVYHVKTPRGVIRARNVVHATNAFTTHLLPLLRRKMTTLRGHMSAQKPGPKFLDLDGKRSWSIDFPSGFDYITQRPTRIGQDGVRIPGEVMAGGGFVRSVQNGLDQMAIYDDTTTDLYTSIHLHGVLPATFGLENWGAGEAGGIKQIWSGLMAFTADLFPFVGKLDRRITGRAENKEGCEWISAGYQGEGMVWAWLCGTALGLMVAGRDEEDLAPCPGRPSGKVTDWFPQELLITSKRVGRIDMNDLADFDI